MILIVSTERDPTTERVMRWLKYYGAPVCRINNQDLLPFSNLECKNGSFDFEFLDSYGNTHSFHQIKSYWYRRGNLNFNFKELAVLNSLSVSEEVKEVLRNDHRKLLDFIHLILKHRKGIGSYLDNDLNKLHILHTAMQLGLEVPHTLVTTQKKKLVDFVNSNSSVITKGVENTLSFVLDEIGYSCGTSELSTVDLEKTNEIFPLTLFQTKLDKMFELRIFYLDGTFYASAIFSQKDEKTKVDFRNYNDERPNQTPPFNLPIEIKIKLDSLMKKYGLKSGSIDMVYTMEGKYVFIEVNPIGQFNQVSLPCNFYLEKLLAQKLIIYENATA